MLVATAFCRTQLTNTRAAFEHNPNNLDIEPRTPHSDPACCGTDICAIQARPDTLRHIHLFRDARVCAGNTHLRAEHRMTCRSSQKRIEILSDIRME
ncbi:hypothetical protein [Sphingobium yanoikuyae]|uniref:hypothetical protein n=1 Tax=Sphingobium yanoikuyae TaxID=13690 RepID=UPI003B8A69E4